jgi:hypothetical protein
MDEESLVTAGELAGLMGLRDAQAVLDLRKHPVGFPAPIGRKHRALVWSWHDVQSWGMVRTGVVSGALGAVLASFVESCS